MSGNQGKNKGSKGRPGWQPADPTTLPGRNNIPTAAAPVIEHTLPSKYIGDAEEAPVKKGFLSSLLGGGKASNKGAAPHVEGKKIAWRLPDGRLHRVDGPALVTLDEENKPVVSRWYFLDHKHRPDGKPAVTYADGGEEYWEYDKRHREGGLPAVKLSNGTTRFLEHGHMHCLTGPANIKPGTTPEWWVDGIEYFSKEDYEAAVNRYNKAHNSRKARKARKKAKKPF